MKQVKTNLNLYKSFIEVYETKNYSNAAICLRLTQPTISYNIKELERQLKVRLFNSNSRGVEPTRNADELYPIIKTAFEQLLIAENVITEFSEKSQGSVNLGLSLYYMPQIVGDLIAEYSAKYQNTKLNITVTNIDEGISNIDKHEIDVYIYAYTDALKYDKTKFASIEIGEVSNAIFASPEFLKKHGITGKITKEELNKLPILAAQKQYQIRRELDKMGIATDPHIESNSTEMMVTLAKCGTGVFLAPESFADKDLVKVPVSIEIPKCHIAVLYNHNIANKAGSAFIDMVKAHEKK